MFDLENIILTIVWVLAVLLSIAIHEYAHAKYADWAGDPTPRRQGRVTLNPIMHLDPLGTILIIFMAFTGYGIGWGKPVPVNPGYFRSPRRDWVLCAFVGPLSNIILAAIFAIPLRILLASDAPLPDNVFIEFTFAMVYANIGLALFNMIPLHPLDGSKVLSGFLRDVFDPRYWNFQMIYGPIILFGSILILPLLGIPNPLRFILIPAREFFAKLLLGA
ncbi:MAG: site-2 protease family protein [Fimbriimonadales bacterium]|nr:site-2 protease family protein [Fimbriimonadales bacterium]